MNYTSCKHYLEGHLATARQLVLLFGVPEQPVSWDSGTEEKVALLLEVNCNLIPKERMGHELQGGTLSVLCLC